MMVPVLTPNPGGTLAPENVVGREVEIARYWQVLERQSLVLVAPRRLGKSSVCRRMNAFAPAAFRCRYRDLEGLAWDPWDFVRVLFDDTNELLSPYQRTAARARSLLGKLAGLETPWVVLRESKRDWRPVLDSIFDELEEVGLAEGTKLVLFWDEFPMFLHDLSQSDPQGAMVLLDRLRAARQRMEHVRMVFTGSIGLEEVLSGLRERGYRNDPTNDMAKEVLPLMGEAQATGLGLGLLGDPAVAAHVAGITQGHPFLIQHVADRLRGVVPSVGAADRALDVLVDDPSDPLELSHYLDRLDGYGELRRPAVGVLDHVAVAPGADVGALVEATREEREKVVEVLRVLRRDLYLVREAGTFRFRLRFLEAWWRQERGL